MFLSSVFAGWEAVSTIWYSISLENGERYWKSKGEYVRWKNTGAGTLFLPSAKLNLSPIRLFPFYSQQGTASSANLAASGRGLLFFKSSIQRRSHSRTRRALVLTPSFMAR